jgi:hypothetical protein
MPDNPATPARKSTLSQLAGRHSVASAFVALALRFAPFHEVKGI